MNRYQPQAPRVAFGVAAVAAAAITLGPLVALPAQMDTMESPLATGGPTLLAAQEPHVDSGSVSRAVDARARRHELLARAMGAVEHAANLRLAGAPRWHLTGDNP